MDTKNMIIICLAILVVVMAMAVWFLIGQQGSNHENNITNNTTNVTNANNTINNTSSTVEKINSDSASSSSEQKQVDYNSPDSDYYKGDTDGSYHKKEEGVNYIYAQDAITGEWSYWADKS